MFGSHLYWESEVVIPAWQDFYNYDLALSHKSRKVVNDLAIATSVPSAQLEIAINIINFCHLRLRAAHFIYEFNLIQELFV